MKLKIIQSIIISIFLLTIISATLNVSLSDQGTGVINKTSGDRINDGDLTVLIYDSLTGGNLIYNETFVNSIQNGSWNVMLGENATNNLSLEYGKRYYKDYQINGEDSSFTNREGNSVTRQFFYSPLGDISEEDISGSTNITTTGWFKGLFNWIINSVSTNYLSFNGTTLFFNESFLNATIDNRATALSGGNLSWNETYADTLYSNIQWNYNQTLGTYNQYNSDWISTYNASYAGSLNNASYLSTYNATYSSFANNGVVIAGENITSGTIAFARLPSLTDTHTLNIANITNFNYNYNQSLATYNMWDSRWLDGNASWNESYADTLYSPIGTSSGNLSWNQSLADTIYSNIQWNYNQTLGTYNQYGSNWYNHTADTFSMYNSTWDSNAYKQFWYNQTLGTYNQYGSNWYNHTADTFSMYNSTWDSNAYKQFWYNQTLGTYNQYGSNWYNHTADTFTLYNSTWDSNAYKQFWYNQTLGTYNQYGSNWYNHTADTFTLYNS
ncbi:MAG: hypothetical protein U9Q06_03620, partial [Nanoarchaeota archaeon]|nr:hypothetical protein [Nanoarchaeota archaeon]